MTNSDETVPHVIMAPRSPDFSFGVDVHDRYELAIPKERLEAMSPLKRRLIKGSAKRVTLTGDDREGAKWRPLPPFFMAGGLTISEPLADLRRGFDLGPALIRPVELTAPKGDHRPVPEPGAGATRGQPALCRVRCRSRRYRPVR